MSWLITLLSKTTSPQEQRRIADEIAADLVQKARSALAAQGNANPTADEINRRAESLYLADTEHYHHSALESIAMQSAITRQSSKQHR